LPHELVETTRYSLSTAPPARPDRRSGSRQLSLLRVGVLIIGGRRELCLVRNISPGGMMVRCYSPIPEGSRISVELKHGDPVSGAVRWADEMVLGVAFDRPIDMLALLSPPLDGPRPRMPRIELSCSATLRHESKVLRVEALNISQGGACIRTTADLPVNGDAVLTLPGLHAAAAAVKWREGDLYGLRFNRAYPVHELMAFLREQQLEEQREEVA
jgi:hypothetical protein